MSSVGTKAYIRLNRASKNSSLATGQAIRELIIGRFVMELVNKQAYTVISAGEQFR